MRYLKKYKLFESVSEQTVRDILLDITDDSNFNVEIKIIETSPLIIAGSKQTGARSIVWLIICCLRHFNLVLIFTHVISNKES